MARYAMVRAEATSRLAAGERLEAVRVVPLARSERVGRIVLRRPALRRLMLRAVHVAFTEDRALVFRASSIAGRPTYAGEMPRALLAGASRLEVARDLALHVDTPGVGHAWCLLAGDDARLVTP